MSLSRWWPVLVAILIVFAFFDKNEVTALADLDAKKPKILKVAQKRVICKSSCGRDLHYSGGESDVPTENDELIKRNIDELVDQINSESEGFYTIEKISLVPLIAGGRNSSYMTGIHISVFYSVPKQAGD